MQQWFVVHTKPRQEDLASRQLALQGFDVYIPKYQKQRKHARRIENIFVPLFPRYIFIGLDLDINQWRSVNGTYGVIYILTHDNKPAVVPNVIINKLKEEEEKFGFISSASLCLFNVGDEVILTDGAFFGQTAKVEQLTDKERVQVLLNFMGRDVSVKVPLYAIEAI